MTELDDLQLLAEFARSASESAFDALVARHVNLVYSTALRFTGNPHHAQEITQAVFVTLTRKAGSLRRGTVLSGWLYQTARLTAANFVKGETRRQHREQEAYMLSTLNESDPAAWQQIAPLLDDAMGDLGDTDRNAVVLRFFENKTAQEVGAALNLTEAAALKRVSRALEKLRLYLSKRGIVLPAAALTAAISANAVQAAPVGLAITISTAAALTGTTLATATTATAIKTIAMTTPQKTVITATIAIVAAVIIRQQQRSDYLEREIATLREQVERATSEHEENQRLTDQLKAAAERMQADARELARLRGQASTMRQTEQENVRLKAERERLAKQPTQAKTEEAPYDRLFGPGGNMRMTHAMRWGYALISYASEHQGQFPASIQESSSFLGPDEVTSEEKAQTALTADQYEILYHGRRDDMTNPPPEGAIVIREKQPWQTIKGTWARTYIYGDGVGTIHTEPDGNFDKWESVRIPKASGQ